MSTIHLVSHTHWDREWYLPFQVFRLKLVHLVDGLLALLASDPHYRFFMLDGQTIVLDDYLQMRPEREPEIAAHVQSGRLLIGPWHVLADEYLVSPEALVRNLLQGDRTTGRFGPKMPVGYTPDPFGHIGQLPQILAGFGIHTAALMRGLGDEPAELFWQAPDGSRVLLAYLRDSYGNAAQLPVAAFDAGDEAGKEAFLNELTRLRDSLASHAATGEILLMQGTDHLEPDPATSVAVQYAAAYREGDTVRHSTLPAYFAAVENKIKETGLDIPTVSGELRGSRRYPLLPGVLSARMWIKQRNHACENLLEKWAEPFAAWAGYSAGQQTGAGRIANPAPILRQAWRLLMECHPHDSICGCSIDQVHDEMRPRFDQVEQIAEQITQQSLTALATEIDSRPAPGSQDMGGTAIVVFNPGSRPRTGTVIVQMHVPPGLASFDILDDTGARVRNEVKGTETREVAEMVLDREGLMGIFGAVQGGQATGMTLAGLEIQRDGPTLTIDAVLAEGGEPNPDALAHALEQLPLIVGDSSLTTFVLHAVMTETSIELLAIDVPGLGYRTYWMRPAGAPGDRPEGAGTEPPGQVIENEYLRVVANAADGTFTLTDKRTGVQYRGLNRLVDCGDCGDEYNYCPPGEDRLITLASAPAADVAPTVHRSSGAVRQTLEMAYTLPVPAELTPDRQSRTGRAPLVVRTTASLVPGVARLDLTTEVDNQARDHRLRVHFPAPFVTASADYDGHYAVVRRPLGVPAFDDTWVEPPRPEAPQRCWTDISGGGRGLMVAARGLPEVEVRPDGEHAAGAGTEIVLTLLRCVGWLSRADLATRRGHAGPALPTPGAQMIGRHHFEYAVIPHEGDWLASRAYEEAYAFDTPMRAVATPVRAGKQPGSSTLVRVEPGAFVLSAVKTADDGQGLIVRGYNIGDRPVEVTLTPGLPFTHALRVRLDETEPQAIDRREDGSVGFQAGGYEIVTVKFL